MADEIVYKKVTRKADKGLEGKVIAKHGKDDFKAYLDKIIEMY